MAMAGLGTSSSGGFAPVRRTILDCGYRAFILRPSANGVVHRGGHRSPHRASSSLADYRLVEVTWRGSSRRSTVRVRSVCVAKANQEHVACWPIHLNRPWLSCPKSQHRDQLAEFFDAEEFAECAEDDEREGDGAGHVEIPVHRREPNVEVVGDVAHTG